MADNIIHLQEVQEHKEIKDLLRGLNLSIDAGTILNLLTRPIVRPSVVVFKYKDGEMGIRIIFFDTSLKPAKIVGALCLRRGQWNGLTGAVNTLLEDDDASSPYQPDKGA